jgi:predicted MPP superfamily phosphohydrolase
MGVRYLSIPPRRRQQRATKIAMQREPATVPAEDASTEEQAPAEAPSPAPSGQLSRRRFFKRAAGATVAAATGTFLYTWRVEPHWVEIVERPLAIAGLPKQLVGKRLVQLSDLHVGPVVDQSFLLRSVAGVGELKPDLIVITGDLMSCHRDEQVSRTIEVLRELPPAPLGRFAILGNHDYGDRWSQHAAVGKLCDRMADCDVRALRNEVVDVGGLQIAGVDDLWANLMQPAETISKLDPARAAIALCHNPDGVDVPEWQGFRGWILAGHTHGGQCKAPFFRPPVLPVNNKRYVAGEYELAGGRKLYINRGLGYLERVRFNCRPEITVFTLATA